MKKILVLFIFSASFIACKEKKKTDPQPQATSTGSTTSGSTPTNKQISVKINGTDFNCTSCGNTYKSGDLSGVNFSEGASNRFLFSITGFLKPGTYPLIPFGNPSFTYEKDGYYYRGRGSLTLTQSDTSSKGNIKKFIGTFNCITDTISGNFYNFSEGALNINF